MEAYIIVWFFGMVFSLVLHLEDGLDADVFVFVIIAWPLVLAKGLCKGIAMFFVGGFNYLFGSDK